MCRDGLTARQWEFVVNVISTNDVEYAAGLVGVSERTARRWLADPTVRGVLDVVEARVSASVIQAVAPRAIRAMGSLVSDLGVA